MTQRGKNAKLLERSKVVKSQFVVETQEESPCITEMSEGIIRQSRNKSALDNGSIKKKSVAAVVKVNVRPSKVHSPFAVKLCKIIDEVAREQLYDPNRDYAVKVFAKRLRET